MIRLFDIVISAVALIVLCPALAIIALLVLCDSQGPVIFSQLRIGQWQKPFYIYKFRTMRACDSGQQPLVTASGDRRITFAGRWLRRWKLDELPQLWNVLRGDMSIVGPRPEVPELVAFYRGEQLRVLNVRPGLTDAASLAFIDEERILARSEDPQTFYRTIIMPEKIRINLLSSLHLDTHQYFRIIFLTALRIIRRG